MLFFFLKAYLIGFAIAAPIGPISVLAIRRALTVSLPVGLATGVGCAVADGLLAAIPAFGLTLIADWLAAHTHIMAAIAGALLAVLGALMWRHKPRMTAVQPAVSASTLTGAFGSGFALTLINPANMLAFAAAFAALDMIDSDFGTAQALLATLGCLAGALSAWVLAVCVPYFWLRQSVDTHLNRLNKLCAGILICGGLFMVLRFILPAA
jgi:threonine/homoserine/homoserine lactone efflux protein